MSGQGIIFWLVACLIGCIVFMIHQQNQIDGLVLEIELKNARIKTLTALIDATKDIKSYKDCSHSNKTLIPAGTIEAVKEAMKRAHPDNGGSEEEFRKYRRAYNVLIGKEKLQ